jgi:superfamily II DNA or RNA helicase
MSSQITLQCHQQKIVDHMLTHRGLIAVHQTGSGKTIAAVASIAAIQKQTPNIQTIVLCPLSVSTQWSIEVNRWNLQNVTIYTPQYFMNIMNDDSKRPECTGIYLIIDEAHNIRTNIIYNVNKDKTIKGHRASAIMKAASLASKVLLLTATPIINTPFDIYNLVMMVEGTTPEQSIQEKQFHKACTDIESFQKMFQCKTSFYSYQTTEKSSTYFPGRIDMPITYIPMTQTYYESYKKIESKQITPELVAAFADKVNDQKSKDMCFTILREAINALDGIYSPKIAWIKDFVFNHQNEKTIIFSNWKEAGMNLVKTVLDQANIKYVTVEGDADQEERNTAVQKYNNVEDGVNVMLITRAGCEGLNFFGTRHVVLMESNWNKSTDEQIIGRAIRHGSHTHLSEDQRTVQIHRIMLRKPQDCNDNYDSIDEEIYRSAYKSKDPICSAFMGRLKELSIENKTCECCHTSSLKLSFETNVFQKSLRKKTNAKTYDGTSYFDFVASSKNSKNSKKIQKKQTA